MRAFLGLFAVLSVANTARVLQDPDALRFFAVAISVVVAVGAVGSVVAVGIVAARRFSVR